MQLEYFLNVERKKMLKRLDKKAYIQDILFFGIIVFILAIIVIVGARLNDDFNTNYQATNASTTSKEIMSDASGRYDNIFDWMFISVLIFFALSIFATVFLLDTHPVFFWVIIVIFGIILMVLAMIGNVFESFSTDDKFATQVNDLSTLSVVMDNWVIILMVIGFIAIILLFARQR